MLVARGVLWVIDFPGLGRHSVAKLVAGRSSLSVRAVDVAIHRIKAFMDEMVDVEPEHWLPEHTLHAFVDPMLRALGWEPSNSQECRPYCSGAREAGYSLFAAPAAGDSDTPDLVVLAAPRGAPLAGSGSCKDSGSRPGLGVVVVLTNGAAWRIYGTGRLMVEVDIIGMRRATAAGILSEWMARANFG